MVTQYASTPGKLTVSSHLFARWHLFWHVGYLRHQQQVDLWPFDLESGVGVTFDVVYLCANFSLPRPLCSRVTPNIHDRRTDITQTDVRQKHSLMLPPYGGGGITMCQLEQCMATIYSMCQSDVPFSLCTHTLPASVFALFYHVVSTMVCSKLAKPSTGRCVS